MPNEDQDTRPNSENIAELRESNKLGKEAIAKNESLERETAFLRAGFDTNDEGVQLAMRGYDGDLDGGSIESAIGSFGLQRLSGPSESSTPAGDEGEAGASEKPAPNAVDAGEALANQGSGDIVDKKSASTKATEMADREAMEGGTPQEAIAVGIASHRRSISEGDQSSVLAQNGRKAYQ
tara:strand:+ start:477 stop:1016 length:540 start_codon:yes stop_codon:yes gene_type:complete